MRLAEHRLQFGVDLAPRGTCQIGGLLACMAGPNVVRFLPPLCITEKDLEEALEMIGDTLDEMFGGDAEEDEDAEDAG